MNKTLAAVLDAARACRWTAYDEDRGTGLCAIPCCAAPATVKVLVTLVTPGPDLPGSKNFCTALRKSALGRQHRAEYQSHPLQRRAGQPRKTLYGPGFVLDTLCGTQFAISSRSFYQVNRTQTGGFVQKSAGACQADGPRDGY